MTTQYNIRTCTIANGASLSDAIELKSETPVAIEMPAAWTSAVLTFQGSIDGTYNNIYDENGTEITSQAAASRLIRLKPAHWAGLENLKIRSGTSGAAQAQGAERVIKVLTRRY